MNIIDNENSEFCQQKETNVHALFCAKGHKISGEKLNISY